MNTKYIVSITVCDIMANRYRPTYPVHLPVFVNFWPVVLGSSFCIIINFLTSQSLFLIMTSKL